jgi:hypothetical protein
MKVYLRTLATWLGCTATLAALVPDHQLAEWSVGKTLYGKEAKLEELGGQGVVISFWSASAKDGAKSLALLGKINRSYQSRGLVVIAAEMQNLEKVEVDRVLGGNDAGLTITQGGRGPIGISDLPHSFVFDSMGTLIFSGLPDDAGFETAVKKALVNARRPSVSTKSNPGEKKKADLIPQRKWVNSEGKDVVAAVIAIKKGYILFRKENGDEMSYPINKLSKEDQKLVRRIPAQ